MAVCEDVWRFEILIFPWMQVEGCGRDLTNMSIYHRRCRICSVHLKMVSFMRQGKEQRFCQQCGRCHELAAFEGTKRACINQLEKHNARCAESGFWGGLG